MKILAVHNYYQQAGGEDVVFHNEVDMLRRHGHEVIEYTDSNVKVNAMSKITTVFNSVWSHKTYRNISNLIGEHKPDIAHFHNTFCMVSPSAYYACKKAGVPVVQSLHNSRHLCPASILFRAEKVCYDCLGKNFAWPGMKYGCYHDSKLQTAAVSLITFIHRILGTWQKKVDSYIVFTEFYKMKFIESGFPVKKIRLKPHFVYPDPASVDQNDKGYVLYIGRLSKEKGVVTLLEAWKGLENIPLKIVGSGELEHDLNSFLEDEGIQNVDMLGSQKKDDVFRLIKGASFVIIPSEVVESFGLVVIEAFACGVPVLVSDVDTLKEVVEANKTGFVFKAGDVGDLSEKVEDLFLNQDRLQNMGKMARASYQAKWMEKVNYEQLIDIYKHCLEGS